MGAVVAIVGRPNVGKSRLFNRLIGRRKAIVRNEIGVTRDLNYGECEEGGVGFTLVDTGGFETKSKDSVIVQVKLQARVAIEDADVILFLLDGRAGPLPGDSELAGELRRSGKPVIFAANKVDGIKEEEALGEFYALGMDNVLPLSAEHGRGINELLDEVVKVIGGLDVTAEAEEADDVVRIAIVGRPNAGKSSLLNKLIGTERAIVSEVAGTTRDSVDTVHTNNGKSYLFIDTAGIRKKSKISLTVEAYSVMEAIKIIERCHVALLVIDAERGVSVQDEKIAGIIEARGRCCLFVVNKWDKMEKETATSKEFTDKIHHQVPFLSYAPAVFLSALTGQRVAKVFNSIDSLLEEASTKIQTSKLNKVLEEVVAHHNPPLHKGKRVKFFYATQTGTVPPVFTIFTNRPEGVTAPYQRYLVNSFREKLGFERVPLRVKLRAREH